MVREVYAYKDLYVLYFPGLQGAYVCFPFFILAPGLYPYLLDTEGQKKMYFTNARPIRAENSTLLMWQADGLGWVWGRTYWLPLKRLNMQTDALYFPEWNKSFLSRSAKCTEMTCSAHSALKGFSETGRTSLAYSSG